MTAYKITAVDPNVRDWESKMGGAMKSYRVELHDGHAGVTMTEWARKATSPAPTVGQTIEGTIEQGQYGPKFKQSPTGSGGTRSAAIRGPA